MQTERRIPGLKVRWSMIVASMSLIAATVLLLFPAACQTDAERIRATNDAVEQPAAEPTPISAEIDADEIQVGDCINSTLPEGISIESVVIVPCDGPWQYRVLDSLVMAGSDYPGEDAILQRASQRCDSRFTDFLFPLAESWQLGDRTIECLQDSFGLSVSDPAKLDRLADLYSLVMGECFNEAPETGDLLVERVDCSGSWEYQVTDVFSVSEEGAYPGDTYLQAQAEQKCERPWDFYYSPSAESWGRGDRTVTCARTSVSAATPQPTATATSPESTATPRPTLTPQPTTPAPTATPFPTAAPTVTPRPTPTATPRPPAAPTLASIHNTQNARWVEQRHPTLHRNIMALPWVKDGLDSTEKAAIDEILYAAVVDRSLAQAIIQLPWVADGIEPQEPETVEEIYFVAHENASVAQALVGMPFLVSNEPADAHALNGIQQIIRDGLTRNLTSSQVYRNGITDEWAPIIAAAAATESGSAITEYLNDAAITIEVGQYTTGGQPLTITIVSPENAADLGGTLNDVYQAVIATESIMQLPLPTRHVIVVFDPRAVSSGFAGTNHNYAIGIEEENPDGGRALLQNTLFHEVAHYWWGGNANWIDEGLADTIAATASLAQGDGWVAKPNRRKECITQNISDLGHTRRGDGQFYCSYYLGEKLFRALQDSMSPGEFTTAIQALYAASQALPRPESLDDYRADIEQVRQAFPKQREIIDLHYTGDLNAPHRWDPDDAINFRHHDVVTWIQKPTYQNGVVSFSGRLVGEATLVSRSIDEARQGGIATFTIAEGSEPLGSILPKLTGGSYWTLDDPADVVADRFDVNGNSFSISFRWPAAAGNPIGKRISIWGYNNAGRTPVIGNRADSLGISFIR